MANPTEILEEIQEGLTKYAGVISSDHAYVHKGLALTAVVSAGSISSAYNISFKTPATWAGKYIHWRPSGIQTSANYCGVIMTEGESFTGGTAVVPINRNRNSSITTKMQSFAKGTTCTPAGTVVSQFGIGTAGVPSTTAGGGTGADQELLLKPDTTYNIALSPAGATIVTLELFWYEENGYHS